MTNFVFYFPYRGVGGVPVLFLRVAKELEKKGYNISYIDFIDGYMSKNAPSNYQRIEYVRTSEIIVPDNSILIFQADLPWGVPTNLKGKNLKIFFWVCYPFNMIPVLPGRGKDWMAKSFNVSILFLRTFLLGASRKCRMMISLLESKNGLSYMDQPCLETTQKYLGFKHQSVKFLPIVSEESGLKKTTSFNGSSINCVWVGRLADFKISILNKVIEDLAKYALLNQTQINMTVVGAGERGEDLLNLKNNFFKLESIGSLSMKELEVNLLEKADLLFAMGTSALEGAKLKLPTIALDFSYGEIKNYKYKFLYEKNGYSLGDNLALTPSTDGMEISEVIDKIADDYCKIANNCYEYYSKNHSLKNCINEIEKQFIGTQMSYDELISQNFILKPTFYQTWKLIKKIIGR